MSMYRYKLTDELYEVIDESVKDVTSTISAEHQEKVLFYKIGEMQKKFVMEVSEFAIKFERVVAPPPKWKVTATLR